MSFSGVRTRIGCQTDLQDREIRRLACTGGITTTAYDLVDRTTSVTSSTEVRSFVTYAFDQLDRLKEVRDGGVTLLALYAYDPLSRLKTVTYDNGAQATHAYELDNDLSQVAQSYGAGSVNFDYLYNLVNQRTDTSVDDEAYLWRPDLDATNSYLPNVLNQYDDVDGTLFTYDGNGNLTGDGVDSYLYDVESRLISAITSQNTADYTYDPQGRRSEKDVDGTVTRYVYAGVTVIAEYDGLDQLQARYIPGLGVDRPVLMDRGGTLSYYHYDGSGSVIAMTDVFGVVAERYAFGPYGESADGDALSNPYRYTGRRLDAETGLYYYRARYYSAGLGRFLQADPAGYIDGLNLYAYVRNDPLNFVDPYGLASLIAITTGATGGVLLLGVDTGFLYVVNTGTSQVDVFTYFGGGIGPGFGLAVTAEVGFLEVTNLEDVTGWGVAASGFLADGFAVSATGFGSTSGEGVYGGTAGAGYGYGFGAAGLVTYTNYERTIDLGDLTEPARELLDGFLGGQ